jgi:chromosome segregation ATPase
MQLNALEAMKSKIQEAQRRAELDLQDAQNALEATQQAKQKKQEELKTIQQAVPLSNVSFMGIKTDVMEHPSK